VATDQQPVRLPTSSAAESVEGRCRSHHRGGRLDPCLDPAQVLDPSTSTSIRPGRAAVRDAFDPPAPPCATVADPSLLGRENSQQNFKNNPGTKVMRGPPCGPNSLSAG
jgi:hypothetical protein